MESDPVSKTTACPHCGMIHQAKCPRIKAYEYHPDGSVKRIEFFAPNDYAPVISGGMAPGFQPIYPLTAVPYVRPQTSCEGSTDAG